MLITGKANLSPSEKTGAVSPFSFFDAVFLINLDERQDRLKESLDEFRRFDIRIDNLYRFPGIKFNTKHPLNGRAGCFSSHRAIIQAAKDQCLNSILVFEDDFCFTIDPIPVLTKCVEFLWQNDWSLFYLGQTTTSEIVEKPLEVVTDGVLRLRGGLATHAIAYHRSIYDVLLNEMPEPEGMISWLVRQESMDGFIMKNLQPKDEYKCYTTDPMLCIQRPSFSNVDEKFADYSVNLMKAFENERKKA